MNIKLMVQKCKKASPLLATLDTATKNSVLHQMASSLRQNASKILKENAKDLAAARKNKMAAAFVDRLTLDTQRIEDMAIGLEEVAALPDPVGKVVSQWTRPNGLEISRVKIPLGVVGVIYESRPNVTVDAAALCFKSGNAVVLRGGSEAIHSNRCLGKLLQQTLKAAKIDPAVMTVIPTTDRAAMVSMLGLAGQIDVIIPRGGENLMRFVEKHSAIPVIKHDKGVCNIYIDASADAQMAVNLVENAKVQRPGVCNAVENVLVHQSAARKVLPLLQERLAAQKVELRGDPKVRQIIPGVKVAKTSDWSTEYLDLILSLKVVKNLDEAIVFCREFGSMHSEAIVTNDEKNAEKFVRSLDSSCVLVNASTRFNDGGQLGLGAEIGISTTKLHAFGPMGLEELTSAKFVVRGNGQIR